MCRSSTSTRSPASSPSRSASPDSEARCDLSRAGTPRASPPSVTSRSVSRAGPSSVCSVPTVRQDHDAQVRCRPAHPDRRLGVRPRSHPVRETPGAAAAARLRGRHRGRHLGDVEAVEPGAAELRRGHGLSRGAVAPQRKRHAPVDPRTTSSGRNTYSVRDAGIPAISSTSAWTVVSPMARTRCRTVVSGGSVKAMRVESS